MQPAALQRGGAREEEEEIGYVDHSAVINQSVLVTAGLVITPYKGCRSCWGPGCQIGYMAHTGCHQPVLVTMHTPYKG
jgi:hypothetical protein